MITCRLCEMMDEDDEGVEDRTDPILHYLRNYYLSHTDRETLLESATVGNRVSNTVTKLITLLFCSM